MPNKVADLAESLGAPLMVALVWLLLVVDSSVLLEGRVLGKRLVTLGTIERYRL